MIHKYSIILPVRNGGEHVKACISSIFLQTISGFELIVLDNCSTDGTPEWINSLNDDRITIIPSGTSLTIEQNWGRIKDIPKNEFITLIGHDDILHPHYLEEMELLIQKHPGASLYQSHYSVIDENGNSSGYCKPMDEMQYVYEFLACQMARTMDSMGTGYMMRSKDYDALGGIPTHYPNLIFADYQLWVMLSLKSYKATSIKECFSYRVHNSASKQTNGQLYQDAFEKYINFMVDLAKENVQVKQVIERYGHDMLLYFCESLSHRILKTPMANRSIKVSDYVKKCRRLSEILIPGQAFEPGKVFRISIAEKLDQNIIGRSIFKMFKKISG